MIDRETSLNEELSAPRNFEPTGPPDRTYKVKQIFESKDKILAEISIISD